MFNFASKRLSRLRKACNCYREKAGFGEMGIDKRRVVYWITYWIYDKIKEIKDSSEAKIIEDIT